LRADRRFRVVRTGVVAARVTPNHIDEQEILSEVRMQSNQATRRRPSPSSGPGRSAPSPSARPASGWSTTSPARPPRTRTSSLWENFAAAGERA